MTATDLYVEDMTVPRPGRLPRSRAGADLMVEEQHAIPIVARLDVWCAQQVLHRPSLAAMHAVHDVVVGALDRGVTVKNATVVVRAWWAALPQPEPTEKHLATLAELLAHTRKPSLTEQRILDRSAESIDVVEATAPDRKAAAAANTPTEGDPRP